MIEQLKFWDYWLFYYINSQFTGELLDVLCIYFREKTFWIPLYVLGGAYLIYTYKKRAIPIILGAVIVIIACDQTAASIIKPLVHRLRPCNNPHLADTVRLLVQCGSGFSFVSAHAANHFGLAVYASFFFRKKLIAVPVLLLWAFAVAYSQVYVGVHYPLDVLAGAVIGAAYGFLIVVILKRTLKM